ncbi:MAG: phosphatidylglycerophosphatase A [Elusimicrobiaceae bacterium]|jgi:phosphatidylglycerophosphatase A|nr:phosphatidylglycerophosphatase A [Elusimicrobiaceae bacterium]MBT4007690.1 phosphatidylglycerophosphatase A [Elusimicrobiaceae bacterium]MBT4439533.1 phosphatidylglycerophosphatase A [Elusimicrobiaceae bacterium]MBT5987011.1 phosphatidylglycerophosphatase A [Elusimicrobiaceae bacterium]MBT6715368.1 phosphatidylglycerophosphatase A [Elusimicrobiaceae bacterium]
MGNLYKAFSTLLFISYIPGKIFKFKKNTGAGFLGTFVALMVAKCLPQGNLEYLIFLIIFTLFSVFVSGKSEFKEKKHDNPKIIIDEACGYFFAIAFLPRSWEFLIAAFILFRIFDTIKPLGIKKIDIALENGWGIVLDDVASGVITNALIWSYILIF